MPLRQKREMRAFLRAVSLGLAAVEAVRSSYMDCGDSVSLCGILTLESGKLHSQEDDRLSRPAILNECGRGLVGRTSGYGTGSYEHPEPTVHGLWPETGDYGSSECIAPEDDSSPSVIYSCYQQQGETDDDLLWFEQHE